jgi:hypothetical protein
VKGFALATALLTVGALWLFSHWHPEQFGACHAIVTQFGPHPTIRECDAYNTADFAVPLGLIAIVVLAMSGDGDFKFTIPGFGTFERTRAGKKAAKVLQEDAPELDRRGEEFLETLKPKSPPREGDG